MKIYNNDVMSALRQARGLKPNDRSEDAHIISMNKREAFRQYCVYNGLIGNWSDYLLDAVNSIFGAEIGY